MFTIRELNAGYGSLHVLFDVSTEIPERGITVLVGPNGSGKSTLIKSIFGLTKIYSGSILYDGISLVGMPPHEVSRRGIAYLPQVDNIFSNLRVRENLTMAGYSVPDAVFRERVEEVLNLFPFLRGCLERGAGTLSGGERQMLAMAMALIKRPRIMMFDEPTANLAPKVVTQILDQIAKLREERGMTIILAEQNARKTLEYGDRALLLVDGQTVFQGTASELLSHRELGKLYLGLKSAGEAS